MSTRDFVVMQEDENLTTPDDVHEVMLSVSQPGHDDHDQYEERRASLGRNHSTSKPNNPIAAMWARKYCRWSCYLISLVFFIAFILLLTLSKPSSLSTDPELLSKSITSDALKKHLIAWQNIANTSNGTRFITSHGFNDSINYIRTVLSTKDSATAEVLQISTQDFIADVYKELSPSILANSDRSQNYTLKSDFQPLAYQHSGSVTAFVRPIPNFGCKEDDYANLDTPYIALIRRSECTFAQKVALAYEHRAVGVLIYNSGIDGQNGLFSGTLGPTTTAPIPVFAIPYDLGITFKKTTELQLYMKADTSISKHTVTNLIAETKGGDANAVIVIGAHLDSVEAGPGLNDDASGSAAVLELATQLSILIDGDNLAPVNKVRFIWFGAEEEGLLGSEAYVKDLNASRFAGQSLNDIALNINLDMLGSPNYVYQIYNGSSGNLTSSLAARSTMIQHALESYMMNKKIPYQLIPFDGRSDYQPFIDADIPASGVCSGVDKMKTMEQRSIWGGLANVQYDPCYHQPCDTIDNISLPSLTTLTSTVAYALQHFALHSGLKQMMTHDTHVLSTSHAYASHRHEIR